MRTEILRTLAAMADPLSALDPADNTSLRDWPAAGRESPGALQAQETTRVEDSESTGAVSQWLCAVSSKWWLLFSVHY
jgi:hypothetical protein